jgi:hypothetical protein
MGFITFRVPYASVPGLGAAASRTVAGPAPAATQRHASSAGAGAGGTRGSAWAAR